MKKRENSNLIGRREALKLTASGMLASFGAAALSSHAAKTQEASATTVEASRSSRRLHGENMGIATYTTGNIQDPWYALHFEKTLDAIAESGVRWIRTGPEWQWIWRGGAMNNLDWTGYDHVIERCKRRGLKTLAVALGTIPPARPGTPPNESFYPPNTLAGLAAFGEYCAGLATHGADAIEVWNEPNLSYFWKPQPHPPGFAFMQIVAYHYIKAVRPNTPVITGGLSAFGDNLNLNHPHNPVNFLRSCFDAFTRGEFRNSFDGIAHHPYHFSAWPECKPTSPLTADIAVNSFAQTRLLRDILVEQGVRNRPIWFTEIGSTTQLTTEGSGCSTWTEDDQAVRAIEYFQGIDGFNFPLGPAFYYKLRDDPSTPRDDFGLL
jgi:hypothetical protein